VRKGLTCPEELLKLRGKGVRVFGCKDLHAKVFVFDDVAVVGSSNASASSAGTLIEAGVEFTGAALGDDRSFGKSLATKKPSKKALEKLQKSYNTAAKPHPGGNRTTCMWLVAQVEEDWDAKDHEVLEEEERVALKQMGERKKYTLKTHVQL